MCERTGNEIARSRIGVEQAYLTGPAAVARKLERPWRELIVAGLAPPPHAGRFAPGFARYFFDCDTNEPASALVAGAEFVFCKAADAFDSIVLLVVFDVPDCDNALPAKLF